ncbi:hypothetical protein C8F04DRAFT_198603 [Mycena alexandri]|uniref:Uncharacterized protein n=1 Tax=Mycena alexandri TaxID=1745969 RepID=A0AAD6S8B0_9AGAR|nr:hypothetical protein C8F04DRAFT_198603 [Mycena alexandri]
MTYFWIQIVHFGIRSTPPLIHSDADSGLGARISEPEESIEHDDFPRFLLLNPFVAEGNLWADYYSKGVMMSVEAKGGWYFLISNHCQILWFAMQFPPLSTVEFMKIWLNLSLARAKRPPYTTEDEKRPTVMNRFP